jgi:heme exporter protein B
MLLAIITTLPLLFERDYEDGSLEQLLLQPVLLELLVFAKICGQWCSHIIPILLASPFLALMANLTVAETVSSLFTLFIASIAMMCLGAIGAALTIGSKRGGLLQALVVMPLYIPILIFASGAGGILFLAGIACASIPLACFASAALIRVSED